MFLKEHFGNANSYPETFITRDLVADYIVWQEEWEDIVEMFNPPKSKEAMIIVFPSS